jgi:hypothetical protein
MVAPPPLRHHWQMGLLCEYFVADSDAMAAATIDWVGGPQRPPEAKGIFRKRGADPFPSVAAPGIDPVVMMGTLGNLLAGEPPYGEAVDHGVIVESRDGGEGLVYRLAQNVVRNLAYSNESQLGPVSEQWVQTDEFFGQGDPAILRPVIAQLASLARQAQQDQRSVYCWLSV